MTDRMTKADVVQIVWQTALVARSLHVVRLGFLPNAPRGRLSHVAVKALRRRQKIHTSTYSVTLRKAHWLEAFIYFHKLANSFSSGILIGRL